MPLLHRFFVMVLGMCVTFILPTAFHLSVVAVAHNMETPGGSTLVRTTTLYPKETNAALHNPYMGWVYIDNAVKGRADAGRSVRHIRDGTVWGEVDHVAVLSTWGVLEPEEGVYDWSEIDHAIHYWASHGKSIQLRISTDPMVIPLIGVNVGVPQWLFDKGLPFMEREEVGVTIRYPDYSHPLYMPHLNRFLHALADHVKNTTTVELVDLRGYGTWGEWHSGHDYATLDERRDILRDIVQAWVDAFDPVMLSLSNSYEWRTEIEPRGVSINHRPNPTYDNYVRASLFDEAFRHPGIALRRDGIAGYVFDLYDGRMMHEFFRQTRRPITAEIAGGIEHFAAGQTVGYTPKRALDEALNFHSNYIMMMGWDLVGYDISGNPRADSAMNFYNKESQGLMQDGLAFMGYRLALPVVRVHGLQVGKDTFTIEHTWQNRALGRLYKSHDVMFSLVANDEVLWSGVAEDVDVTEMVAGELYRYASTFDIPDTLTAGTYSLRVALVDEHGAPAVQLAVQPQDEHGRAVLGDVVVARSAQNTLNVVNNDKTPFPEGAVSADEPLIVSSDELNLEPGGTYVVSFRYDVTASSAPDFGVDNRFTARLESPSGGAGLLREIANWTAEQGRTGTKTVIVTLGDALDYTLRFEAPAGYEMTVSHGYVQALAADRVWHEGFDDASVDSFLTWTDASVVSGRRALTDAGSLSVQRGFDARSTTDDDFVFLQTKGDEFALAPNRYYTVSFKFHQTSQKGYGSYFYVALVPQGEGAAQQDERLLLRWLDDPWTPSETKSVAFVTGDADGYTLAWGVRNGGEGIFDDVTVVADPF